MSELKLEGPYVFTPDQDRKEQLDLSGGLIVVPTLFGGVAGVSLYFSEKKASDEPFLCVFLVLMGLFFILAVYWWFQNWRGYRLRRVHLALDQGYLVPGEPRELQLLLMDANAKPDSVELVLRGVEEEEKRRSEGKIRRVRLRELNYSLWKGQLNPRTILVEEAVVPAEVPPSYWKGAKGLWYELILIQRYGRRAVEDGYRIEVRPRQI